MYVVSIGTVEGNWMQNVRFTFANEEHLDMDFVHEFCNRKAPAADNEYYCRLTP
jgi:hypothetical protein